MRRWCWLMLLLLGFDGTPVIGPEFEPVLAGILDDLAMFDGARIERDRVILTRGDERVTLLHPSEGGARCGPFGMVESGRMSAEEVGALCVRLARVEDPFHEPLQGSAQRGASGSSAGPREEPAHWTYDRPPSTTLGRFLGVAGVLLLLALGAASFVGWVLGRERE